MLVIAFTLGTTSCAKHKVKKDVEGTWTMTSQTQNGVDVYASMGVTYTGTWVFNKKDKTCTASYSITFPGNPAQSGTDVISYKVEDKETILLDGESFHIQTLTDNELVLTYTDGSDVMAYNFTK